MLRRNIMIATIIFDIDHNNHSFQTFYSAEKTANENGFAVIHCEATLQLTTRHYTSNKSRSPLFSSASENQSGARRHTCSKLARLSASC